MSKFTIEDKQIIEENEKWFKFFVYLPKAITIILAIIFAISGIALGAMYGMGRVWLVTWLMGAIVCAITFAIVKLSVAYKILHIYYLKKLSTTPEDTTSIEE